MDYKIRKLEENDLPTLVELCREHAEYENSEYNPKGKEVQLKNAIFSQNPDLYCYVIESEGEIGGYFSFTFDFSTWDAKDFLYLDCLFLRPNFRGVKIGEAVFERLKRIAIENRCVNIQWQTPTFNHRAIKFYDKIGALGKDKRRFVINL
ncbi:MAG: N-acetyltransferase [Flavobacteriaceae bacterium]|nr:MAG: N-acetyltransferase [Flavobacteriaceae bacterium]